MTKQQLQEIKEAIGVAEDEGAISATEEEELCAALDDLYNHAQLEGRVADVATVNAWAAVEDHELFTARYEQVLKWCNDPDPRGLHEAAAAIRRGLEP